MGNEGEEVEGKGGREEGEDEGGPGPPNHYNKSTPLSSKIVTTQRRASRHSGHISCSCHNNDLRDISFSAARCFKLHAQVYRHLMLLSKRLGVQPVKR